MIDEWIADALRLFDYGHLPPHLQEVSKPFHDLAYLLSGALPKNRQLLLALDKLVESKDCAVRARLRKV